MTPRGILLTELREIFKDDATRTRQEDFEKMYFSDSVQNEYDLVYDKLKSVSGCTNATDDNSLLNCSQAKRASISQLIDSFISLQGYTKWDNLKSQFGMLPTLDDRIQYLKNLNTDEIDKLKKQVGDQSFQIEIQQQRIQNLERTRTNLTIGLGIAGALLLVMLIVLLVNLKKKTLPVPPRAF